MAARENGRAVERSDDSLLDIVDWLSSLDLLDIRRQWDYSIAVLYRWQLTTKREIERNITLILYIIVDISIWTNIFLPQTSKCCFVPKGNCFFLLLNTRLIRYDEIFLEFNFFAHRRSKSIQLSTNYCYYKVKERERERERSQSHLKTTINSRSSVIIVNIRYLTKLLFLMFFICDFCFVLSLLLTFSSLLCMWNLVKIKIERK